MDKDWLLIKESIGTYAASLCPPTGSIGLGSGTTSHAFIEALAKRYQKENLNIHCLATSIASYNLAKMNGLPLLDARVWDGFLDITFDGADVLFDDGTAIKGAGGALLREKIVARASKKLILMIDERKWNSKTFPPLPVDITPFGAQATLNEITKLGFKGSVRKRGNVPFLSDDNNWIVDIELNFPVGSWQELDTSLKSIPGVIETGIFYKMASSGVIGFSNGEIKHHKFKSTV